MKKLIAEGYSGNVCVRWGKVAMELTYHVSLKGPC